MTRFELASSAWQGRVLPLNYTRVELDYLLKCVRPVRYLDYDLPIVDFAISSVCFPYLTPRVGGLQWNQVIRLFHVTEAFYR